MLRYETLFIAVPEITSDESSKVQNLLETSVKNVKGAVISFERWGKYHLAYPIRKFDYGVYYLMRFEVDEKGKNVLLDDIRNLFGVRLGDLVMRNVLVRLDPNASLEYKRPESLEEAPSKDIDVIMKESKGFLGPKPRRSAGSDFDDDETEIGNEE